MKVNLSFEIDTENESDKEILTRLIEVVEGLKEIVEEEVKNERL